MRRIGMAPAARRCDAGGKDRRLRIVDRVAAMRAVTARAGRHLCVAAGETLAVHARGVLRCLVDALARRVFPHELCIAVATAAGRNLGRTAWRTFEPTRGVMRARLV